MRAKRKLLISMLAIVFVLLAVVATVAIAFALTQQTITTTLNIGYVVEDIDGTASATYTIGGVTESLTAMKGDQVIGDTLVFHAGDTEDAGNLMFPEGQIPLSAQNDNIVIQYTYSNTGAKHYIASMSFDGNISADNMKVEYSIDGTTYSEQRYAVVVPANTNNKSYWIKISIENKAKSASFTGDFKWLLEGCDEQSEEYLSLSSVTMQGSNGSYSVSFNGEGEYLPQVVFPGEVNGDPVTAIAANWNLTQEQKDQVTSVYIPDSVTKIGDHAFYQYQNLQKVTFEQNETGLASTNSTTGLQLINDNAFMYCSSLKELIIPNTVTSLGLSAFEYAGLVEMVIPDSVTGTLCFTFLHCSSLKKLVIGNGIVDLNKEFIGFAPLETLVIGSGVTSVHSCAFDNTSTNLKNITTHTLNSNVVTAINNLANKNSEMNLTIDTVETINAGTVAFAGLTSLVISDSLKTIYDIDQLVYNCSNVKLIIEGDLNWVFECTAYQFTDETMTNVEEISVKRNLVFSNDDDMYNINLLNQVQSEVDSYASRHSVNIKRS